MDVTKAEEMLNWLVSMDDPENPDGMRDRRTVTLNSIILKAKDALA